MSKVRILIVEDEGIIANNIADALEDFGYDPVVYRSYSIYRRIST